MKTWLYGILLMVVMFASSVSLADVLDLGVSTQPIYDTATLDNTDTPLVPATVLTHSPASGADWRMPDGISNYFLEKTDNRLPELACA